MENFGSWSVLTTNFLMVLYIALGGIVFSSVLHLVNGKWRYQVRNLACAFAALFPVAGILLIILLLNGENTFQWLAHAHDEGHHLPGWHNYTFLVSRQIIGFLLVAGMCAAFIRYQYLSEVDTSYRAQRRFRNIALLIPFMYFGYGTMMAWDFEMTMWPNWHSSSYGAYHFQSGFHMFLAFFTVFLFFLYRAGRLPESFEPKIFNYMAQFLLAMTILWTYLYFTQYLIMWYGRIPDEMTRFHNMMGGLAPLWWTFLVLKFVIPLGTLVLTPSRHNPVIVTTVAICIVVGYWIERYTWIAGTVDPMYYQMPLTTMFGVVVTVGVIAASWWAVSRTLNHYNLIRKEPAGEPSVT